MPTFGPITLHLNHPTWLDTGIDLPAGLLVRGTATGQGKWDLYYAAYPNGSPGWTGFPIDGSPLGVERTPFSLLIAVTPSTPGFEYENAFQGGYSFSFVSPGGRLYVGFNDIFNTFHDNTGAFEIQFEYDGGASDEEAQTMTRYLGDQVTVWGQFSDLTLATSDASSAPALRVYEETTDTPIFVDTMTKQDDPNTAGFYRGQFEASTANGFETGKTYCVRASATVAGINQAKVIDRFVVRPPLATSIWDASIGFDTAGSPTTYGASLRRLISRFVNRMTKSGNIVTLYGPDSSTVLSSQSYSVTDTGFDRSPEV